MPGYFPIDHGDLEHPVFGSPRRPYTRWEAYCWLLDHAAFDRSQTEFQGKPVTLDRGQVAISLGEMARAWRWTRPAVQRFIKGLISANFVVYSPAKIADTLPDTPPDTTVTRLTLCRYSAIPTRNRAPDTPPDTRADTPAEMTQYRDIYVKEKEEGTGLGGTPAAPSRTPSTPRQGDLLPTASVVPIKPVDDVQTAFEAYQVIAKDLGLAVPLRLEGKRRSSLRLRVKELNGLEGWGQALDALRGATFITSGRWKAFSIDDMVNREKLERLLAGGYSDVWDSGKTQNPLWAATLQHRELYPDDSFFHDFDSNGALKQK